VVVVRVSPVALSIKVTLAPVTTAPELSVTVPTTVPVATAWPQVASAHKVNKNRKVDAMLSAKKRLLFALLPRPSASLKRHSHAALCPRSDTLPAGDHFFACGTPPQAVSHALRFEQPMERHGRFPQKAPHAKAVTCMRLSTSGIVPNALFSVNRSNGRIRSYDSAEARRRAGSGFPTQFRFLA
jgi:hypothetical protein